MAVPPAERVEAVKWRAAEDRRSPVRDGGTPTLNFSGSFALADSSDYTDASRHFGRDFLRVGPRESTTS